MYVMYMYVYVSMCVCVSMYEYTQHREKEEKKKKIVKNRRENSQIIKEPRLETNYHASDRKALNACKCSGSEGDYLTLDSEAVAN